MQPRKVSCPVSLRSPSRWSRPRTSAPSFRLACGIVYPRVRSAKPTWKRSSASPLFTPLFVRKSSVLRVFLSAAE